MHRASDAELLTDGLVSAGEECWARKSVEAEKVVSCLGNEGF